MAPKAKGEEKPGKKSSAKPSEKSVDKPPEKPPEPPKPPIFVPIEIKLFWFFAVLIMAAGGIGTLVMYRKYMVVKAIPRPFKKSLDKLKKDLAVGLGRPELERSRPFAVSRAVENLPNDIKAVKDHQQAMIKQYYDIFSKMKRSSLGPWKLHGRSLYYFSKERKTWYDAENFCVSRDAHLASILDNEEQNFTSFQIRQPSWIGLIAENNDGQWRWSDGSRLEKEYWSHGKPNAGKVSGDSRQDCTLMVPSLTARNWNGENCYKLHWWICKEDLNYDGT